MLIRFANLETAAIVLISVIALFFFPAPRGSFVSTHGPITELRARCETAVLWVRVAVSAIRRAFVTRLAAVGIWRHFSISLSPPKQLSLAFSVLRI